MNDPNPELYEAITEHWGERCAEYDPGCFCCRAWDQFDAISEVQKRLGEAERENSVLTRERDAWQRSWRTAIDRLSGPTNEAAATNAAEEILHTLHRWRTARLPGPFFVDAQVDAPSIAGFIKTAITGRTEELESNLAAEKLRAETAEAKLAEVPQLVAALKQIRTTAEKQIRTRLAGMYGWKTETIDKCVEDNELIQQLDAAIAAGEGR